MLHNLIKWAVAFIIAAVFNAVQCYGQTKWTADVHAGVAMTRVWAGYNMTKDGWFFQAAPVVGIAVSKAISNSIALQGELNYDEIRSKREGLLLLGPGIVKCLPAGKNYYAYVNNFIDLDYLSASVLLKLYFGNESDLYVEAGPYIACLLNSRFTTKGKSIIYQNSDTKEVALIDGVTPVPEQSLYDSRSMHKEVLPVDIGGSTGAGMQLPFGNKRYGLAVRYTFGILNIHRTTYPPELYKTDQLSIRLSYKL